MARFQRPRPRTIISTILIVAVALIIGRAVGLTGFIEQTAIRLMQPVQVAVYRLTNQVIVPDEAFQDLSALEKTELIALAEELRDENEQLTIRATQLQSVVDQSGLLQEQIDFLSDRSLQAVPARITSRSTEQLAQSVVINKGRADGIQEGQPVVVGNGILIGTINEVQATQSIVQLVTSTSSRISARVQNEQGSIGIATGSFNLTLQLEFVPELDQLETGQTVLTSGADEAIPEGLIIGTIEEVISQPGTLFQEAALQPFFTVNEVSIVSVISPSL